MSSIIALSVLWTVTTETNFSAIFGNHMVLQRAPDRASVYGISSDTGVEVTFNGQTYRSTVVNGAWKVALPATEAGGAYTIGVSSAGGKASISDVTFGDVWFCSGQSNMELKLHYTVSRNASYAAAAAGKRNIRLLQLATNQIPDVTYLLNSSVVSLPWKTATQAAMDKSLDTFSAVCYYYGENLQERMEAANASIPLGLIQSAVGGTMIEEWLASKTQLECASNVTCTSNMTLPFTPATEPTCNNGQLYNGMVAPFVNMTLKGFLWYQGENNLFRDAGNAANKDGYACLLQTLISSWRDIFSVTPGTTNKNAAFGNVLLADATDEGWGCNVPQMHWAETGNYGFAPNPALPYTFLATAHDIGEPWSDECQNAPNYCCVDGPSRGESCGPIGYMVQTSQFPGTTDPTTPKYMGGIHPRVKKPLGKRLAQAAWSLVYGNDDVAWTGPVVSGCTVSDEEIVVTFNETFLKGDTIVVSNYSKEHHASAAFVLVGEEFPENAAANYLYENRKPWWGDNSGWKNVEMRFVSSNSIALDISALKGQTLTGVKYGHGVQGVYPENGHVRTCCGTLDISTSYCPPENCPIKSSAADLPAMPFMAQLINSKCKCLAPQECDA